MRLCDFINNTFDIEDKDKLTTRNFWNYFDQIKKDNDLKIYISNDGNNYPYNFATHKLRNIINENSNINIFCIGGDICIPPIKDDIMLSYSNETNQNIGGPFIFHNYTDELQKKVMEIDFKNKLEVTLLDGLCKNNIRLFSTQVYLKNTNLHFIPLGIQLHGTYDVNQNFCDININLLDIKKTHSVQDKQTLCYLNCSFLSSKDGVNFLMGNIRELCYNSIKDNNRDFITTEKNNIHNFPNKYELFVHYYTTLCKCKFCLCPPNFVPDTYRIWDCLYMGCIPVVIDFEGSDYLKDLPILFIEDYKKFLTITEDELTTIWEDMINKDYNYEKLLFSHWEKHIKENML
jgi:hypothetical protein